MLFVKNIFINSRPMRIDQRMHLYVCYSDLSVTLLYQEAISFSAGPLSSDRVGNSWHAGMGKFYLLERKLKLYRHAGRTTASSCIWYTGVMSSYLVVVHSAPLWQVWIFVQQGAVLSANALWTFFHLLNLSRRWLWIVRTAWKCYRMWPLGY